MQNKDEGAIPEFKFTYTSALGVVTEKTFNAETWMQAAQEFVYFLRGAGFILDKDALQLNSKYFDMRTWFESVCETQEEINLVPDTKLIENYFSHLNKQQGEAN